MLFLKKKQLIRVGLTIHLDELRIMRTLKSKKGIEIVDFEAMPLNKDWLIKDKILKMEKLTYLLKGWVNKTSSMNLTVGLCLNSTQVVSKSVLLPSFLKKWEREYVLQQNVKNYFPTIIEPLHMDHVLLEKKHQENEILVIAANASYVESCRQLINSLGLKLKYVEVDIYALGRVCHKLIPDKVIFLIYLEKDWLNLMLLTKEKILFHHYYYFTDIKTLIPKLIQMIQEAQQSYPLYKLPNIFLSGHHDLFSDFITLLEGELNVLVQTLFIPNCTIPMIDHSKFIVNYGTTLRD